MLEKLLGRPLFGRSDDAILPWFWHSQNLDERPGDDDLRATGSKILHGRGWLHMGDNGPVLKVSWNLKSRFCHLGISVDSNENEITASAALPPVAFWIGVERLPLGIFEALGVDWDTVRHLPHGVYFMDRRTEVSVHDGALWWSFWMPDGYSDSRDPKWRRGCFNLLDALLGSTSYSVEGLSTEDVSVPMPEGTYEWTLKWERATWTRPRWPRWPFKKTALTYHADAKDGDQIPVPGKGENSWDCGSDAIYGTSGGQARSAAEAIGRIVESALRTRQRHGGSHVYVEGGKYDPTRRAEVRA